MCGHLSRRLDLEVKNDPNAVTSDRTSSITSVSWSGTCMGQPPKWASIDAPPLKKICPCNNQQIQSWSRTFFHGLSRTRQLAVISQNTQISRYVPRRASHGVWMHLPHRDGLATHLERTFAVVRQNSANLIRQPSSYCAVIDDHDWHRRRPVSSLCCDRSCGH